MCLLCSFKCFSCWLCIQIAYTTVKTVKAVKRGAKVVIKISGVVELCNVNITEWKTADTYKSFWREYGSVNKFTS